MLRFYQRRRTTTATAETRRMAQRLTRRGFRRCTHAAWSAARAEQDRQARMDGDLMPPSFVAAQDEPVAVAPTMPTAAALPKVYASSWRMG
jgi:hypothetical protein